MLKTTLIYLVIAGAAGAVGNPQPPPHVPNGWPDSTIRVEPWGKIRLQTCLNQWTTGTPGAALQIGAYRVKVQATIYELPGTGWHGHTATAPYAKPVPKLTTYTPYDATDPTYTRGYALTGIDGCVNFTWRAESYSGWYFVKFTPLGQMPCDGPCMLSPKEWAEHGVNVYLGAVDWASPTTKAGFQDLGQVVAGPIQLSAPISHFVDTRHSDRGRTVTQNTVKKLAVILSTWISDGSAPLDIMRGSLKDGGIADNQFNVNGTYAMSEWTWSLMEAHMMGQEIDVVNPGPAKADRLQKILSQAGCSVGRLTPDGFPVSPSWWSLQLYLHITCDRAPMPPQGYELLPQ